MDNRAYPSMTVATCRTCELTTSTISGRYGPSVSIAHRHAELRLWCPAGAPWIVTGSDDRATAPEVSGAGVATGNSGTDVCRCRSRRVRNRHRLAGEVRPAVGDERTGQPRPSVDPDRARSTSTPSVTVCRSKTVAAPQSHRSPVAGCAPTSGAARPPGPRCSTMPVRTPWSIVPAPSHSSTPSRKRCGKGTASPTRPTPRRASPGRSTAPPRPSLASARST